MKETAMPFLALQGRRLQTATALIGLAASATTWAHEGHGMEGSHWHATDGWGLLALAAAVALYYRHRK
jgi:hypothetical protein